MNRRRIITAVLAALIVGAAAHADLTPVSGPESGRRSSPVPAYLDQPRPDGSRRLACLAAADLDARSYGLLPLEQVLTEPTSESPPSHILADRQSSVSLCLYALLGLGLCKAAPCVKKLSRGGIPQWYHDGGPYQIGHSLALSPDCVAGALVCFVQPRDDAEEPPSPAYGRGTVAYWWHRSQGVLTVLAPRGPPSLAWNAAVTQSLAQSSFPKQVRWSQDNEETCDWICADYFTSAAGPGANSGACRHLSLLQPHPQWTG